MINLHMMIKLLCESYPGFRDVMVKTVDSWVSLDGEFLWYMLLGGLSDCLVSNIGDGDYERTDQLFECVERLIDQGEEDVVDLITTGFLEGMLNQRDIGEELWRPLLGINAKRFCDKVDDFYGD